MTDDTSTASPKEVFERVQSFRNLNDSVNRARSSCIGNRTLLQEITNRNLGGSLWTVDRLKLLMVDLEGFIQSAEAFAPRVQNALESVCANPNQAKDMN